MSDSVADAGTAEFTQLWRKVSTLCGSKSQNNKKEQQMSTAEMSPQRQGFQSPKAINCRRFTGFNNGDSPGDVEPSQDIIWDPTSPTAATTGHRNTRVVEISDIVNRIAPKEIKQQGAESPLLQWIGDSVLSTPDIPKQRGRRKSARQNTVEDLVKLARQFDKNMQDRESSERAPNNDFNNSSSQRGNTCKAKLGSAAKMKDLQCSSSSDGVEAELQALFDCSTQRVSGRLSQGSSVSSCSQDVKDQPAAALLERSRQTGRPSGKSAPAAGLKATASRSNDFDDDWENDELLNDPLLLEITHNPPQIHDRPETTSQTNAKRGTDQSCSGVQSAKTTSARQPSAARSKLTCSTLQDLCPKLKTTNRSTFKLEPNLCFQAEDLSRPALTPPQPKPQTSPVTSTTTKTHQPVQSTSSSTGAAGCSQGVSDSLWDDGDDDTLLYQVCDSVERISNTQLDQGGSSCTNRHPVGDRAQTCTAPVHIEAGATSRAQRESPRTFVRSNSLPATGSQAGNYRGWDVPLKGANKKPHMSQSLPGSHMALGTSQPQDWSGKFQNDGNDGATKACLVTTRTSHTVFKRNFSDSAVPSNKVFVTSQMAGKCSAAEIERKKQEALARRRQRMQNGPKP